MQVGVIRSICLIPVITMRQSVGYLLVRRGWAPSAPIIVNSDDLNTATSPVISTRWLSPQGLGHSAMTRWTASEVAGLDASRFVGTSLICYPTFDSVDGRHGRFPPGSTSLNRGPHPVIISLAAPKGGLDLVFEHIPAVDCRPRCRCYCAECSGSTDYGRVRATR